MSILHEGWTSNIMIIRFKLFKKIYKYINIFFVIYNFSIINMFTLFSVLGLIAYPNDN